MRRLLKFGCIGVIMVAVIAVIAAVLGPQRTQTGQLPRAVENTPLAEATAPAAHPTATTAPAAVALEYDVASEEIIEAPNGRTRVRRDIVIPESGPPEGIAAALADSVRKGFAENPQAVVSIVFGYGPDDDIGSGFTRGRASASRDGQGLDPGSDQLLLGQDTGQIQIQVVKDNASVSGVEYLPLD